MGFGPTMADANMVANLTIVRNPASDREFERVVAELVQGALQDPRELEARLRERYPRAVVRPRLLAGETTATWYVYREGHWVAGE
ncbi:MAG: hypothetical protein QOJ81_2181 [Chloroflexota bacterium]|nr:hypothetical protein [Chloroflexota bacterium]